MGFGREREELLKQVKRFQANVEGMLKIADAADSGELTGEESKQFSSAYEEAMSARAACHGIISFITKEKVGNDRDLSTEIDPGLSNIATILLKIILKREIPKVTSSVMNVGCLAEVKTGPEREQSVKNALTTFKAAEAILNRELAPSSIESMDLALRFSEFYYNILKSPGAARSIAMQAVDKAMPEWKAIAKETYEMMALDKAEGELDTPKKGKQFLSYLHRLCHNVTCWTSMIQDDGVTETKNQENNGAEISVIKEAAPIKRRKLTEVFGSGPENQSMATLRERLDRHAKSHKQLVAMMEKIATAADSGPLTLEERCLMKCASLKPMNARIGYWSIISYIKEQKNDDCLTEIDPAGCSRSDVGKVLLKVLDSRDIPYAPSGRVKVEFLRKKAEIYMDLLADGMDRKEAVENILSTFETAQGIADAELPPSDPGRLGLAIKYSEIYYKILNSADGACKIAKKAVDEAVVDNPALGVELAEGGLDTDKCRVAMEVLHRNINHWISIMQLCFACLAFAFGLTLAGCM